MPVTWIEATKTALQAFSKNNNTIVINRQTFINQALGGIVQSTASIGQTPTQTLSRVLQELRDEGFVFFSHTAGEYTLNQAVSASHEDLPEDVLDNAILRNELLFEDVDTASVVSMQRVRKGTAQMRKLTLQNYQSHCALCDISDTKLLVTSHIVPWALDALARGRLDNVICLCTLHDKLFEVGYFSLNDNYDVMWRTALNAQSLITWKIQCTSTFTTPQTKTPSLEFIARHRKLHHF